MRGASRCVWCSKVTYLIEAELFAATGVSVLHRMAAHCHARRITQGKFRALQRPKICPTHGTEPPYPPFRCATDGSRSAKDGKGSQEGTGNHMVSCPLLFQPVNTGPPGRRRRPKTPSMGHILAFCIEDAGTGENVNLCLRIEKMCFCIEENYPSDKTKSID